MNIQLSDGQRSIGLDQANTLCPSAQVMVCLDGTEYGPFPAAEAVFYATRTSHSSHPQLSMQRFARIHTSCSFKTDVRQFLTAC